MTIINPPSRYLRMQDEELHVEETRNSISPSQSHGRRVTTRNQEEQYLHEHYHEYETRNSFSPTQSHGRRVRIDTNEAYQQEQQHEGDSIQTETYISDDEDEKENIGSTSHGTTVTRKETRALGKTRKSRLNKGSLVFEVDESFGRIIGKNSQGFITKGGCVMRKYAKLDGTTWKKQPDLLKTDIISKTTENSNFDFKCTRMRSAMSSQLGYQHRNHQYKLHIHYKEYETMEEAMTHPRREGKEVLEIKQYKMAHYSKRLKGMINEEADTIWNDLQAEEATSSCTSAEICLKKLGHLPGHIKGRSASTKQILETVNLRSELKALKEENKATNEKVDYLLEEMKKMAQLLQQFQTRLCVLVTGLAQDGLRGAEWTLVTVNLIPPRQRCRVERACTCLSLAIHKRAGLSKKLFALSPDELRDLFCNKFYNAPLDKDIKMVWDATVSVSDVLGYNTYNYYTGLKEATADFADILRFTSTILVGLLFACLFKKDMESGKAIEDQFSKLLPCFHTDTRIGIIGAGPSGLSAAYTLCKLGYMNVTVLEKHHSVRGKCENCINCRLVFLYNCSKWD
ncbi:Myb domain protein 62 [Tanacetum coccineum]